MKSSGTDKYIKGIATNIVFFRGDVPCCRDCIYYKFKIIKNETRHLCMRNFEILTNPANTIGTDCDLEFIKE
jgi:hypothetical protein